MISKFEQAIANALPKPIEIDICIISYAKTPKLQQTTQSCIESLLNSEHRGFIQFNIFVVESNKNVSWDFFPNTKTIYTNEEFKYNRYLNIAIKEGKAHYLLMANNDLIFEKNWASHILHQMQLRNSLFSVSPFCPETNNPDLQQKHDVIYGNTIREQLNGWAIFVKRKIFDIIKQLPEDCNYWFSDRDYAKTLQKYNIKHALVIASIVHHHPNNHGATGEEELFNNADKLYQYTWGDQEIFNKKWNEDHSIG